MANWRDAPQKRILMDNGAYKIKFSTAADKEPMLCFNGVGKDRKSKNVYIGQKLWDELEAGHPNISITHPIIRGLLHDSDLESLIWKQCFQRIKKFDEKSSCLSLALPPVLPDVVEQRLFEMVFEDFEFDAFLRVSTHTMAMIAANFSNCFSSEKCCLVVDSGFSFTYGVPFFNGIPLKHAATRIDVGGKLLTNLLNETVSYKEVNLQGDFHIVNEMKEQACFISNRFEDDLQLSQQAKNPLAVEYLLPDYKANHKGVLVNGNTAIPKDAQIVKMANERF